MKNYKTQNIVVMITIDAAKVISALAALLWVILRQGIGGGQPPFFPIPEVPVFSFQFFKDRFLITRVEINTSRKNSSGDQHDPKLRRIGR